MEIIRKKICFENYRSRTIGMMPHIRFNDNDASFVYDHDANGNYGGFPANPLINGKIENYMDMIRKYNFLKEQFRNGIKLKKVIKNSKETWITDFNERRNPYSFKAYDINIFNIDEHGVYSVNDGRVITNDYIVLVDDIITFEKYINYNGNNFMKIMDEDIIGLIYVPDTIKCYISTDNSLYYEIGCPTPGIKMPEYLYYVNIKHEITKMNDMLNSNNPCVIKEWEELGGEAYVLWLKTIENIYLNKQTELGFKVSINSVPTIDCQILLTNTYNELGLMSVYDEDYKEDNLKEYKSEIITKNNGLEYFVESKLDTLRLKDFFYDDNGNILPGILLDNNKYYNVSNGVVTSQNTSTNIVTDYETFTLESSITNNYSGLALIKYLNNYNNPMKIPYEINKPINSYALKEKYIKKYADISPKYATINYNDSERMFTVIANGPWEITTDKTWVTCNPSSGGIDNINEEIKEYKVKVITNNVQNTETCTLTLNCQGYKQNIYAFSYITKGVKDYYLRLIRNTYDGIINYNGGSFTFTFEANDNWQINAPSWILLDKISGNEGNNIVITASMGKNNEYLRNGDIKISMPYIDENKYQPIFITVSQEGSKGKLPIFELITPKSYNIDYNGKDLDVIIKHNYGWNINYLELPEWIYTTATTITTNTLSENVSETKIPVKVKAHVDLLPSPRTFNFKIGLNTPYNNLKETIMISQTGNSKGVTIKFDPFAKFGFTRNLKYTELVKAEMWTQLSNNKFEGMVDTLLYTDDDRWDKHSGLARVHVIATYVEETDDYELSGEWGDLTVDIVMPKVTNDTSDKIIRMKIMDGKSSEVFDSIIYGHTKQLEYNQINVDYISINWDTEVVFRIKDIK